VTTAIFFELDRTLLRQTGTERPLKGAFEGYFGRVEQAWLDHYDDRFAGYFRELVEQPRERALTDVCAEFGLDATPEELVERLAEAGIARTTVSDDARTSLQKLAANNELGILTNGTPDWTERILDEHDLLGQFDAVVTSYEAGAHKPDGAPFELARERLPADEYVLVGDDYERDVEGARAAGFVPVHFEGGHGDTGDEPDFWQTLNALS